MLYIIILLYKILIFQASVQFAIPIYLYCILTFFLNLFIFSLLCNVKIIQSIPLLYICRVSLNCTLYNVWDDGSIRLSTSNFPLVRIYTIYNRQLKRSNNRKLILLLYKVYLIHVYRYISDKLNNTLITSQHVQ